MQQDRRGNRSRLAAALGLLLLAVALIHVGPVFQLILPRPRFVPPGAVLLGLGYLVALSFLFKGRRFTAVWCSALLLAFALGELGARTWLDRFASPGERQRFLDSPSPTDSLFAASLHAPHHYTLYNPLPDLVLPNGPRHNRLGLRDHRELDAKNRVLRVVFIGGSTTYSPLVRSNRHLFTALLEEKLNRFYRGRLKGYRVEVVNAGMVYATSAESLLRLIFFVSEVVPDLVVIQHGISDSWPRAIGEIRSDFENYVIPWRMRPYRAPRRPLVSVMALKAVDRSVLLTAVTRRLGHRGLTVLETTRPQRGSVRSLRKNDARYFERNTRFMIHLSRAMGAEVLLASNLLNEEWDRLYATAVPQHNAVLRRLAAEEGTYFYDFAREMKTDADHIRIGKYVTRKGSELKSELFFEYPKQASLIPLLLERAGGVRESGSRSRMGSRSPVPTPSADEAR
jgi:hypothetical protein